MSAFIVVKHPAAGKAGIAREMNTPKNLLWVFLPPAALVVLVISLVMLATKSPTRLPSPFIAVYSAGYSNSPDGRVFARFALSNMTASPILYVQPYLKEFTRGSWSEMTNGPVRMLSLSKFQQTVVLRASVSPWDGP